jgi:AhpD family alkylhydroperoxidase
MYNVSNLTKLKLLDENSPEAMKAFWAFDKAAFAPGAIDTLNKQLMAVGVALTTQCPYCIQVHVRAARSAALQMKCWQRRQRLPRRCAREGQSHTRVTCSRTNGPEMVGAPKRSKPQECLAAGLIKFPLQMVPEFGAPTHDLGCR